MESEHNPEGVLALVKMMFATFVAGIQNRGELLLLEVEEEKTHLIELLIWAMAVGLLGVMFLALLTVLVIFMFPPEHRIYALAGFCALYFIGAIVALLNLRSLLKNTPPAFSASINELKKDSACLESSQ